MESLEISTDITESECKSMKYIIMADGKGTRWNNYNEIPKHFIRIGGERIIDRCVRLLHEAEPDCEIIITSHDERYDIPGTSRYEPLNNILEIDRFTEELIADDICFMYGDTYYSEEAIDTIINTAAKDVLFFGNGKSIIAVKVSDGELFREHVARVRQLFLDGKIESCKGWQVYQSLSGLPFGDKSVTDRFILIGDNSRDFNSPEDLGEIK